MSVLVTGGAGYIGSHALVQLIEKGLEVVVVDNLMNSSNISLCRVKQITGRDFPFYEIDLCDKENLERVFKNHKIDTVIHFAGLKAVGESVEKPLKYYQNNLTGTLILLELMQKYCVKNLVFSSSATVYGDPESVPVKEDAGLGAMNPYGRTKWMIELILKDICISDPAWHVGILRYFNPVGAHDSGWLGEDPKGIPNNLVPFIAGVASGKQQKLQIFGNDYDTADGTGVRDYIHVDDLVRGHLLMLEKLQNSKGMEIYNLGTGEGYSVLEMVKGFEVVSSRPIAYEYASPRAGDIATCYADTSLAKEELGFEAKKGIEDMLRDTWRWQEKNPKGYEETTLLVMAAGLGSRYGGIKQMEPVGPSGEFILDYSIHDSIKAGFKKVVFIINKTIEQPFREMIGKKWESRIAVEYVLQELTDLPGGFEVPVGRVKPWGTGHAVLAGKKIINGPFAVINADDFYGKDTFVKLYDFLARPADRYRHQYGMVGFELGQTITDNGAVARGICQVGEGGRLEGIVEHTDIRKENGGIYFEDGSRKGILDSKTIVSMNTWAFTPDIFTELERGFERFLRSMEKDISSEFYLPDVVDALIRKQEAEVLVMESAAKWYGMTYSDDREHVVSAIEDMVETGLYPRELREVGV